MSRLHLVRAKASGGPAEALLAEDDTVVYIEPHPHGLRGRTATSAETFGPDELLERIFQSHAVVTW